MRSNIRLIFTAAIQFAILIAAATVAQAQIYGGRATAITASITSGSTTNYVSTDTGQLPAAGGDVNASSPSFNINGVLATGVLTASSSGALKSSQSFTVVNDFLWAAGGVSVRANRITVRTGCICCPDADVGNCSASTQINSLTLMDPTGATTTVTVTGAANQVVNLPGGIGTVTINEQTTGAGGISVNGLHIRAATGGSTYDVVAGFAQSTLQCLTTGPTAGPVTVTGRVLTSSGQPISRASVSLTDEDGKVRSTMTNSGGYFTFTEVPSGFTYILNAAHRMYTFSPQAIGVQEDITVNITAN